MMHLFQDELASVIFGNDHHAVLDYYFTNAGLTLTDHLSPVAKRIGSWWTNNKIVSSIW